MKRIVCVFVVLFVSCLGVNPSERGDVDCSIMSTVIVPSDKQCIGVDDVIADVKYVKLEATSDVFIGEVSNLYITEDHIVVSDHNKAQAVFVFDKSGKSLAVINRLGRGPQEYLGISHVTLTPDNKRVVIYDNHGHQVLFYDLSGRFVERKPVDFYWWAMEYVDAERVVCATYGLGERDPGLTSLPDCNSLVYYTDSAFQIQQGFLPNQYDHANYGWCTPHLAKFRDTVYLNPSYCDTIYQVTSSGLKARYLLDMSEVDGIANLDSEMTNQKLEQLEKEHMLFPGKYADGADFVFFKFMEPNKFCRVLYSKRTDKAYRFSQEGRRPSCIYFLQSEHVYNDQFVSAVPAYQVLMGVSDETKKAQPDLYEGLTDESNPVLFFYTLKEPE